MVGKSDPTAGLILGLRPANERRCYFVPSQWETTLLCSDVSHSSTGRKSRISPATGTIFPRSHWDDACQHWSIPACHPEAQCVIYMIEKYHILGIRYLYRIVIALWTQGDALYENVGWFTRTVVLVVIYYKSRDLENARCSSEHSLIGARW